MEVVNWWALLLIAPSLVAVLYGAALGRAARDGIAKPVLPANDDRGSRSTKARAS